MAELPAALRRKKALPNGVKPSRAQQASQLGSWLLLVLAMVICALGSFAIWQNIHQSPQVNLYITGELNAVQEQQLYQQLSHQAQGNFYTIDLETVRDAALQLPWLDRVTVSRHWPNGLVVRAAPRHPIARWGSKRLLSDNGHIFTEAEPVDRRDLPLLHGPNTHANELMQQYRQINQWFAPLGMQLLELHLTDRMTWFMQFNNGMRVIVDQDQTLTKLQRLSQLGATQLKPVWPNIVAADLRYRNGLALQWKNAQPPLIKGGEFILPPLNSATMLSPSAHAMVKH